jgi:hypothetical protein
MSANHPRLGRLAFTGLAALASLAPALTAQPKAVTLPAPVVTQITDRSPLGLPSLRYQLWFSRDQWLQVAQTPFRINRMDFVGGPGAADTGFPVTIAVRMANSFATSPTTQFDLNFASPAVTVLPQQTITLPNLAPGTPVPINFSTEFVWDGVSGVVVDVRMYGNGNNDQPFDYFMLRTIGLPGRCAILSAVSPSSVNATRVDLGQALVTTFRGNEGVTVDFGAGCLGASSTVPRAFQTGGVPRPANPSFKIEVDNIGVGLPCVLFLGLSRETWAGGALPFNLDQIGFAGSCPLLVSPDLLIGATSFGTGRAFVDLPIPPITAIVGGEMFGQWWVIDPSAVGGILSVSQGLWTQFGQ